jgi:hypothetical protein
MNVDEVLRQLDARILPREAVQWALDHWEEAAPRFISKLRMLAQHGSNENTDVYAIEYIIHLCAEKRDARAFAPVCDLIATDESIGDWLVDPSDETLPGILINLCDGDVGPLKRAIESEKGDEFFRGAALSALAYLVRERKVLSDDEMREYLLHLREHMRPRDESYVWTAWALAIARLGYEPMRAEVGRLFSQGWIIKEDLELERFYADLQLSRRDLDGLAAFLEAGIGPFGSTIETFESREASLDAAIESDLLGEGVGPTSYEVETPYFNPHRDVGRNDPCPCGSGKKFKKCCLAA